MIVLARFERKVDARVILGCDRAQPQRAHILAPRHLGARVAYCHVLRLTGDVRGAIREGLAALSQAPGDPDVLHAVGLAYHARGEDAATRKYLEAYLATNPEFEVATDLYYIGVTKE